MPDTQSTPEQDATARLLSAIEADAEGRLRLPPGGHGTLRAVRLDGESLAARGDKDTRWWQNDAPCLRHAAFAGADLPGADFSGADLTAADFSRVTMRATRMRGARMEGCRFADADLTGIDFADAMLNEADFTHALLEDAQFTGAVLRFAGFSGALLDGAGFDRADLWAARLDAAEAINATFRGAVLHEAVLAGADLTGADLSGAELKKANLQGAKLRGTDLRGADLRGATLAGADLTGASLPRVDLSSCDLTGVRLAGAWLSDTRFSLEQLGAGLGDELDGDFSAARRGYLGLEQNFRGLGDPEAARACYLRARRMGKRMAAARLRAALRERQWRSLPLKFGIWFGDAFAEWLCDYGESLPRVLRAMVTAVLAFALFYEASGTLIYTGIDAGVLAGQPSHDVVYLLGFSFLNMCTSGVPDFGLKPASHLVYFITSLQYVVGLVLIGLFGYVLGNRIRR